MTASALSRTQRVFLLGVLAFCLVAMHHLTTSTGMSAMSPAAQVTSVGHGEGTAATEQDGGHPTSPHDDHGFLHLCLAVLGAIGALLAGLGLLFRLSRAHPVFRAAEPAGPRAPPPPARPPDRPGRLILNSLCVLRV
ncbi:hypothetical protein [Amycolatopsis sp. NPDC057786]|uniref:hypothetical protein n=1 Tax=Amycolatopsis sp. NPDC057786 TaxID=3346250 RepID=UPI00366F6E25